MEALSEIQLPPVTLSENAEQSPVSSDKQQNSTDNLPAINTDDLPITPLRNKRWLNNVLPTPDSPKANLSLSITSLSKSPSVTPTKTQDNNESSYAEALNSTHNELNSLNLPNTDNLLDISVPKTTVLGKEQAKKRLYAFSLAKQNNLSFSPLSKKKNMRQPKFLLQPAEDKYNENGEKTDEKFILVKKPARKNANPNEKAKAVIEEIEEIKKIESAYLEALEQGLLDHRNRRSRSKSRSRERSKRRSSRKEPKWSRSVDNKSKRSWDKPKYPTDWAEVNSKGYDFETLANIKPKEYRSKDNEPVDFRKQLLFQTPSRPIHRLSIKGVNGKEKTVQTEYIRFTNKSPKISYSVKEKIPNDLYSRKCILQYVPKSFRDIIKKITNSSVPNIDSDSPAKSTTRKWFPKTILGRLENNTECKILETSLGLSFLQTYSDEDEQEKELNDEVEVTPTKSTVTEDSENVNKIKILENLSAKTENSQGKKKEESESKSEKTESEEEVEEMPQKTKKIKKKEKKNKAKPKKEKHKKKTKSRKENEEKDKKGENLVGEDDAKKKLDKCKESESRKIDDGYKIKTEVDESRKAKRNRSKSLDTKEQKTRTTLKEEKLDKGKNSRKRTNSNNTDKSVKEQEKTGLNKSENLLRKESKKDKLEQPKENRDHSRKKSSERSKLEEKHKSRSRSPKSKLKKTTKRCKSKSPHKEQETRKVKCVAEKEFGTPDTEEYYSNWESDVELSSTLEKPPLELLNQSVSINQSWQSDDDPLEISDITISDIPLVKSPFKDNKSPLESHKLDEQRTVEQVKRTYKRDKSTDRSRRLSLRDVSSSPLRTMRSRHLDSFPVEMSPIQNEFSPKQFSPMQSSPTSNDYSPFRKRCIEERRRSRRSVERSPSEQFLEIPLNIRNTRDSYSRHKWEEERFENSNFGRSPDHSLRIADENKIYALYAENPWERDDYLTIKTEERRLEEERRTLIEERRKLEIERRQFEELERQRYYKRMTEFDEERCSFEERRQVELSDDEEKRYRVYRDYREGRNHPTYSKENDTVHSRRSSEDQRLRRRHSSERSQEVQRERMRDNFGWEENVENKRSDKYFDQSQEKGTGKRRRKSRWQNLDDSDPFHYDQYIKSMAEVVTQVKDENSKSESVSSNQTEHKSYSKEKKISRKNRWESSEDEVAVRDDKKSSDKIRNRQEEPKRVKDIKHKETRDKQHSPVINREKHRTTCKKEENKERSLTDNLDLPPRKPQISRASTQATQKPEVLENEYEKFMQALGSEISTAEEISDKDFKQPKRKSKLSDKRIKKRKSYSRSSSVSSDEEYAKNSKREVRKRKIKKRVSSSSSSSTSSSSSESNSSSESSSISSSTEFSSDDERKRKSKSRKKETVKIKIEHAEVEHRRQEKHTEPKLKSSHSDMSSFDVIGASRMKEKGIKEVIKVEESEKNLPSTTEIHIKGISPRPTNVLTANKPPSIGANLNIMNLTLPEFSLGEIPLPHAEISKITPELSEVPLPVPSPKISLVTSTNDPVMQKIEPIITKIESTIPPLSKKLEAKPAAPILPEITPAALGLVLPVTFSAVSNIPTFIHSETEDVNTILNIVKEEPSNSEESKCTLNITQTDTTVTPPKRNNLIPIKFLTPELRKQANESPNWKPLGTIEAKQSSGPSNQGTANEVKINAASDKGDAEVALPLTNRKRHFAMSSMNIPAKRTLFDGSDNDENSIDFTDKFIKKDEKEDNLEEVSTSNEQLETTESRDQAGREGSLKAHASREKSFECERTGKEHRRRHRSMSPKKKRDLSPRSYRRSSRSPHRHDLPRRKERELSPRSHRTASPGKWDRNGSPRRTSRDLPARRYRDDSLRRSISRSPVRKESRRERRSLSPRDSGIRKYMSVRHRSPSPKRHSISREFSPRRHRSKDRSTSKERKAESIQETLQRIAGVDRYTNLLKRSPISSPLHGFKRSVADSTISDDQLLQHNTEEYTESPGYNMECFKNTTVDSPPPKRMSLDERINQALGLADQPKPISTIYSENYEYDSQYFDQYGQYYEQYNEQNQKSGVYGLTSQGYRQARQRESSNLKVVQVGNVLQVVPTEDVPSKQPPVQHNKITNSTQKIVQVGNMLQIVPTAALPEPPIEPPPPPLPPTASTSTLTTPSVKDPLNAEALIKQKAERRAEKDKRRQERERKRKEKEKKRKEREKRKQLKVKLQTEALIKQALIRETEEAALGNEESLNTENASECQTPTQWPPVPQIIFNSSSKPPGKGILNLSSRLTISEEGESKSQFERRKTVKFSDGVIPGEGTSPSGGEELSSPPPAPKKLPKEKRFVKTKIPKKIKVPKKKKVKVKVIRQQQTQGPEDDDEDEDDNLPPPPPPPGSPPPHIFPARIKHPVINNVHPNIGVSIANPPLQATNTSYPPPPVYRPVVSPQQPVIMHHHGHHHGPPHMPPHHGHHHHPPPCPPPHVGFNPPPVVIPPVIAIPSPPGVLSPFGPPSHHHHHHHHGGHHHHHHSPHHHGHHHHHHH